MADKSHIKKSRETNKAPDHIARLQKIHGPRYFRTVWAAAVEQFFGDEGMAERWMTSHCPELGGKPVEIAQHAEGRNKILLAAEIKKLRRANLTQHTSWGTCRAFYPSKFNNELLFRGTELPATHLFYDLSRGGTIETFIRENPGVTRKQVDLVFEQIILDLCNF